MSTQGVFILKRNGAEKGVWISHDAYPDSAGQDIIDLIKTTDLSILYDQMIEYDDMDFPEDGEKTYPKEPEPFSYDSCRMAGKNKKQLLVSPTVPECIKTSLFCEYAYVINLDQEQLLFFIGNQIVPQEGNPYGEEPVQTFGMAAPCFPCRLVAMYELGYVKKVNIGFLLKTMISAAEYPREEILHFTMDTLTDESARQEDYEAEKEQLRKEIDALGVRLHLAEQGIADIHPASMSRIRELFRECAEMRDAVTALEKRIETIK